MTTLTHTTALVLIPPCSIWPPIQAIRREHDRHLRRWMPHITLLYPFRPLAQFADLVLPLVEACQMVEPFAVTLAEFRHFDHGSNSHTLWLAPEPKQTLIDLQTALWRAVPDYDETRRFSGGFTPHLSVGQWQGEVQKMLQSLQSGWTPLHFQAVEVSLIWRDDPPDDVFRVWRSIRLGRTTS